MSFATFGVSKTKLNTIMMHDRQKKEGLGMEMNPEGRLHALIPLFGDKINGAAVRLNVNSHYKRSEQ